MMTSTLAKMVESLDDWTSASILVMNELTKLSAAMRSHQNAPAHVAEHEPNFFLVNHDQHVELLKTIVPDSKKTEVTEAWVTDLDELLIESDAMQSGKWTPGGRAHIRDIRAAFEDKLDIDDPQNALHTPYQKVKSAYGRSGLLPSNVIGIVLELTKIGGGIENGIRLLQKGNHMLAGEPKVLTTAYAHIQHLTQVFGWEGDVRQLLLDVPDLLRMSVARRAFIGRFAMTYGTPELRQMDTERIKRSFLYVSVDEYLLALMAQQEDYRFEHTPKLTAYARRKKERIYERLGDPKLVGFIGPKILQAYFRYSRPKPHVLRKHPHVAKLLGEEVLGGQPET